MNYVMERIAVIKPDVLTLFHPGKNTSPLLSFLNHSFGILETANRQGPGLARYSCDSSPCRCQYRRKPGLLRPFPPLRCSPGMGSPRVPSFSQPGEKQGHRKGNRAETAPRWPVVRGRAHTHTHTERRSGRGAQWRE